MAIVGNSAFLVGQFVEFGLGANGAFGSDAGDPIPAGLHPRPSGSLGFVSDSAKDGWENGYDGDFFIPGSPEEGWGIQVGGVNYNNNNDGNLTEIAGGLSNFQDTESSQSVDWIGSIAGLSIAKTYSIDVDGLFVRINVALTNTTEVTLTNVYYMRNVDPDNNQTTLDTFVTTNTILNQPNTGTPGFASVSATQTDGSTLVLLGTGDNVRVVSGGFDNRNPGAIFEGGEDFIQSGSETDDVAIALAYKFDTIAAGATVNFEYQYQLSNVEVAPVVNAPLTLTFNEDDATTTLVAADLLVGASDGDGDLLNVSNLTLLSSNFTTEELTSTVTLDLVSNTISLNPSALGGLDSGSSRSITVEYAINDGKGNSVNQTATLTIEGRPDLYWHQRLNTTGLTANWQVDLDATNSFGGGTFLTPAGSNTNLTLRDLNWNLSGIGDFNDDGYSDVVWRSKGTTADGVTGAIAIWTMNNGVRTGGYILNQTEPNFNWDLQAVGDLDDDGDDDLIWRNTSTGQNAVWFMQNGQRASGAFLQTEANQAWTIGGVGDFDGDGRENEIVWRNTSTGQNAVWFMDDVNGTTRQNGVVIRAELDTKWTIGGVADFNGDGSSDVLWRHTGTTAAGQSGAMAIWFMNGTNFTNGTFLPNQPDQSWQVAA